MCEFYDGIGFAKLLAENEVQERAIGKD